MVAIRKGGVRTGSIAIGVIAMVAEAIETSICSKAANTVTHPISTGGSIGASARVAVGAVSASTRVIPVACGISHAVKASVASAVGVRTGAVTCHPRAIVRPGVVGSVGGASANPVEMANMQTISSGIVSCGLGSGFVRRRVVRGSVVATCGSHQSDTCDCWNEPFLIHWNTSYTIECPHCDRRFRGNFSSYCLKYGKMVVVCTSEEGADLIRTQAGTYEVMEENRDGWNPEAFKERYSDILDKYDYIVGDWGYGQLRLRGFYSDANRKVPFEQRISALDEYLQEFCNFGCPYFVLQKVKGAFGSDETQSQDLAAYDAEGEERQELVRDDVIHTERKDRRRFNPRQNKQDRSERGNAAAGQEQRAGSGRGERSDKPRLNKDKMEKGRDNGKDRRPHQARPNRERDKVSSSPNTNPPKREG